MNIEKARERYQNDPLFRQLVDAMMQGTRELKFSPGELREAAVYAEFLHQMRNAHSNLLLADDRHARNIFPAVGHIAAPALDPAANHT